MDAWRPALVRANAQRCAQRVLRNRLVSRQLTLQQALGDVAAQRLPANRVIAWLPRWSLTRADRLLLELHIWPHRPCGQLTPRERREIGARVR